jgi:hypothetical protein
VTDQRPGHLLVVGAQRCGTTYLRDALDAHPEIAMARPARPEPKVFCDAGKCARGVEWYHRTWFAHARDERLLGDKSTSYLEDPKAAARAGDMLGEVHVVAVLRDPVARAVSNWRLSTRHGLETRPLEEALRADLDGEQTWDRDATSVSPFAYLRRGRYVEQLEPWTARFPASTHVLFLEELLTDSTVLEGLVRELGLDPEHLRALPQEPVNASAGPPPALSAAFLGTVRSYFEASDAALSDHLGRRLPW